MAIPSVHRAVVFCEALLQPRLEQVEDGDARPVDAVVDHAEDQYDLLRHENRVAVEGDGVLVVVAQRTNEANFAFG